MEEAGLCHSIELKDLSDLFKMAEFIKAKYRKTLTAEV